MTQPAPSKPQRFKLTLAYKGTRFKGWQIQGAPQGKDVRTVQGCLEQAFGKILGSSVRVQGAGRTDSGVHALGQVAHVDIPADKLSIDWQRALNGLLPGDVSVVKLEPVLEDFHARFSSIGKVYTYSLWLSRRYVLPQRSHYVWVTGELDSSAMEQAAELLVGEHNFAAFQNVGTEVSSTVRLVHSIVRVPAHNVFPEEQWRFEATGFLKQMVRNMMGCLVAVGRGACSLEDVHGLLEKGDRSQAPATAPARGLTLTEVRY